MTCQSCGKAIKKKDEFCPHCGTKVEKTENAEKASSASCGIHLGPVTLTLPQLLAGVGGLAVLVILLIVILSSKSMKMVPEQYVRISVMGVNETGQASFEFDRKAFLNEVKNEKKLKPADEEELEQSLKLLSEQFELSKSAELSNNEVITVHCIADKDLLKKFKITLQSEPLKYTVAGLVERYEFHVMDYLQGEVKGYDTCAAYNPYLDWNALQDDICSSFAESTDVDLSALQKDLSKYLYDYYMTLDITGAENGTIKNGDVLSVSCQPEENWEKLEKYGIVLKVETVEKTVSELPSLIPIDLAEYVTVELKYSDLIGEVSRVAFDFDAMAAAIQAEAPEERNGYSAEEYLSYLRGTLSYYLRLDASTRENLSNGDEITINIFISEGHETDTVLGLQLTGTEKKVTVEGLPSLYELNLMDYVKVEYDGFNGTTGTAKVQIDKDAIIEKISADFPDSPSLGSNVASWATRQFATEVKLKEKVTGETFDPEDPETLKHLTNGDILVFSAVINNSPYYEKLKDENCMVSAPDGIRLNGGTTEVKVEGLPDPVEVDLTEIFDVQFSGSIPKVTGKVMINRESPLYELLDFNTVPWDGSTFTLDAVNGTVVEYDLAYKADKAEKYGYTITNTKKSFTVSGMDTYDFAFESMDAFDAILKEACFDENGQDRIMQKILDNDYWISNNYAENSEVVLWDQVKYGLVALEKRYGGIKADDYSGLNALYQYHFPVVNLKNGSVKQVDVFANLTFRELYQAFSGEYHCNNVSLKGLYKSKEEAQEDWPNLLRYVNGDKVVTALLEDPDAPSRLIYDESERTADPVGMASNEPIPSAEYEMIENAAASIEQFGHVYDLILSEGTWKEAKVKAEKAGGHLVTITSEREQQIVNILASIADTDCAIGAYDTAKEGTFSWINGEPLTYTNWYSGQPDNYGENGEDFVGIYYYGQWNDFAEDNVFQAFIMEREIMTMDRIPLLDTDCLAMMREAELVQTAVDSYGASHTAAISMNARENSMLLYKLNGNYSEFTGTLYASEEVDSDSVMSMAIFGDGKLLYLKRDLSRLSREVTFTVDVTGVDELKVMAYNGERWSDRILLTHALLNPAEEPVSIQMVSMQSCSWLDQYETGYEEKVGYDLNGYVHDHYYEMNGSAQGEISLLLHGDYEKMSLLIEAAASSGLGAELTFSIFADGTPVLEETGLSRLTGTREISVDVTGVNVLTLKAMSDSYSARLRIYEDQLTFMEHREETEDTEDIEKLFKELFENKNAEENLISLFDLQDQEDMVYYSDVYQIYNEKDSKGNLITKGHQMNGDWKAYFVLNLDGQYSDFAGIYHSYCDNSYNSIVQLAAYGDGKLLWKSGPIDNRTAPTAFYIQTEGVRELKMMSTCIRSGHRNDVLLEQVYAKKSNRLPSAGERIQTLSDLQSVDQSNVEHLNGLIPDTYGGIHNGAWTFENRSEAYKVYLLDKSYSTFKCTIAAAEETKHGTDSVIRIYGDDQLLFETDHVTRLSEPQSINLDVSGVTLLKIESVDATNSYGNCIYLMDDRLN